MSPQEIKQNITTINHWKTRFGYPIKGIILHSMWGTYKGSIAWFRNPTAKVSAHYLIDVNGEVSMCVQEEDTAWHAGVVTVEKEKAPTLLQDNWGINPNLISIGVEMEDKKNKDHDYPAPQYEASVVLVADICKRHGISPNRGVVIMHKETDPLNRSDPVGQWDHDKFVNDVDKQMRYGTFKEGGETTLSGDKRFYPIDPLKTVTVDPQSDGVYVRSEPTRRYVKKSYWAYPFYKMVQTNLSGSKTVAAGRQFRVKGFVRGETVNDNYWWWVSEFGNYVWSGATIDKPSPQDYPSPVSSLEENTVTNSEEIKKNMADIEALKTELGKLETARDIELAEVAEKHREMIERAREALNSAESVAPVVPVEDTPVNAVEPEVAPEPSPEAPEQVKNVEDDKAAKIAELEAQLVALKGE